MTVMTAAGTAAVAGLSHDVRVACATQAGEPADALRSGGTGLRDFFSRLVFSATR